MKDLLPTDQLKAAKKNYVVGIIYNLLILTAVWQLYTITAILLLIFSVLCGLWALYKIQKMLNNPLIYLANVEAFTNKD